MSHSTNVNNPWIIRRISKPLPREITNNRGETQFQRVPERRERKTKGKKCAINSNFYTKLISVLHYETKLVKVFIYEVTKIAYFVSLTIVSKQFQV